LNPPLVLVDFYMVPAYDIIKEKRKIEKMSSRERYKWYDFPVPGY
jgi:hypothetical protein